MDEKRLSEAPLFASLSKRELQDVARHADEVDLSPGKELVHEGDFAFEVFAIEEGTAEVRHGDQHVADLGPGDFFGETGAMSGGRRSASVVATSPMTAIVMTARDFRHLANDTPSVAERIKSACEERSKAIAI
jgi:CRP-like cAMP-binding protein